MLQTVTIEPLCVGWVDMSLFLTIIYSASKRTGVPVSCMSDYLDAHNDIGETIQPRQVTNRNLALISKLHLKGVQVKFIMNNLYNIIMLDISADIYMIHDYVDTISYTFKKLCTMLKVLYIKRTSFCILGEASCIVGYVSHIS